MTARSSSGDRWQATVDRPTEEPPWIGSGVVLVQHVCGWSVLDLETGAVLGTGSTSPYADAVGVAHGFVFVTSADVERAVVEGMAVAGDDVDGNVGMLASYPGADRRVWAAVVDDLVYIASDLHHLEQGDGVGQHYWDANLPVLDDPAIVHAGEGGESVVVASADGSLYGLDRAHGEVRWRTVLPDVRSRYDVAAVEVREGIVRVTATYPDQRSHLVDVRARDGKVLRVRERQGQAGVMLRLESTAAGWTVRIESDGVPHEFGEWE